MRVSGKRPGSILKDNHHHHRHKVRARKGYFRQQNKKHVAVSKARPPPEHSKYVDGSLPYLHAIRRVRPDHRTEKRYENLVQKPTPPSPRRTNVNQQFLQPIPMRLVGRPIILAKKGKRKKKKKRGVTPRMIDRGEHKFNHCVGCGGPIHDQYILRVAPNLEWHAACLKCSQCSRILDESCTCFVREGSIFCKEDYLRLYGTRCERCGECFTKFDYVMRAKSRIYHQDCFRCRICDKQLVPGEEFALRNDGSLFCKQDRGFIFGHTAPGAGGTEGSGAAVKNQKPTSAVSQSCTEMNNNEDDVLENEDLENESIDKSDDEMSCDNNKKGKFSSRFNDESSWDNFRPRLGSLEDSASVEEGDKGRSSQRTGQGRRGRAGRVRTVLTEKQLSMMKSCYAANPRPDALMKEQLVEMTGLSARVIRVWFQNKRCKDKKKAMLKQTKEGRKLGYSRLQGFPMVATSPMRHDVNGSGAQCGVDGSSVPINPTDIHSYEPPWKALCDFALHSDLDKLNSSGQHHYQQLMNHMHGYDYRAPDHPPPPSIMYHGQPQGGHGEPMPYHGQQEGDMSMGQSGNYTLTSLDTGAALSNSPMGVRDHME